MGVLAAPMVAPRVLHRPDFDDESDANAAVELMSECGQTLDLWQILLVCVTLATLAGKLAASMVGALVARQNGKGAWLETIAIWSLFEPFLTGRVFGPNPERPGEKNETLWTAHELKTSDTAYRRVKALIEANERLAAEVLRWDGGLTGQHIIELRDGSRLVFLARSKSSARGFSPRRVIIDEAQQFPALAHRALMYATAAQGEKRQLLYTGTVPAKENESDIWTGIRDVGRQMKSERLAWVEWSPRGSDDPHAVIDPTSWDNRRDANPALDIERAGDQTLTSDTIDAEWEAAQSDIEGFLIERLSVWPNPDPDEDKDAVVNLTNWNGRCLDPGSLIEGDQKFVLDVSPGRAWATFMVVGYRADGIPQAEVTSRDGVFDHRPGVEWIVPRAAALKAAISGFRLTLVSGSPAEPLIPALTAAGIDVEFVKAGDVPAACGYLFDQIEAGAIRHIGQDVLTDALKAARKNVEDGETAWRWGRRKSASDITPVYAMTIGLWALTTMPTVVEPTAMWL